MNIIAALRDGRPLTHNTEVEIALLRMTIAGMVTLFLGWALTRDSRFGERDVIISLTGLAAWFAVAIGIFASIRLWPASSVTRRVLGILADVGIVTLGLFQMGERGVFLVGAYLFIILGNGFRFGRAYLYVSQVLSLIGFILVLSMVPWWRHEPGVSAGLLIMLLILPLYVGVLTERMKQAWLSAEQALKECEERERRRT